MTRGRRLRHQPRDLLGYSQDWNFAAQRWKDEADYYADEQSKDDIVRLAACPKCNAPAGQPCDDPLSDFHQPRKRAAGEEMLRRHGPRFGGEAN